jgi:hypothetical protein
LRAGAIWQPGALWLMLPFAPLNYPVFSARPATSRLPW